MPEQQIPVNFPSSLDMAKQLVDSNPVVFDFTNSQTAYFEAIDIIAQGMRNYHEQFVIYAQQDKAVIQNILNQLKS